MMFSSRRLEYALSNEYNEQYICMSGSKATNASVRTWFSLRTVGYLTFFACIVKMVT